MKNRILIAAGVSIALLGSAGMAQARGGGDREHRADRKEQRQEQAPRKQARISERASGKEGRSRGHQQRAFDRKVDKRLDRQSRRIAKGVRSGELTRYEAKRLKRQQHHIAKLDRRMRRDGRYNKQERRRLWAALDNSSHSIKRARHNDRYRDTRRHGRHYHPARVGFVWRYNDY